jgi:hypothetical protein
MRWPNPLVSASIISVAGLALLVGGCGGGGSSSPSVASVASSTSTTTAQGGQAGLLAFSTCMRSHGEPSFPDPQHFAGGNLKLTVHNLGISSTPQFEAAWNACDSMLPSSGGSSSGETAAQVRIKLSDGLSFARCMRSHGVARFPDPNAQGVLSVQTVQAQGIDVHSPQILRVVTACIPASHGWLTPAKVAEALRNAGG